MEKLKIVAAKREVGKKGFNRRLRKEGHIPAILYGHEVEPQGLCVNAREFTQSMKGVAGTNALIELEVANQVVKGPLVVMLKDFQTDPLTLKVTHIDLFRIDMKERVTIKVPIHLTGKAVGVTKGGLVEQIRRELEVKCLPDNIPDGIEVDITALDVGNSLHVNELKLPSGVEMPHGSDFAIVSIVLPREEKEEVPAEAVVPEAGAAAPVSEGAPAAAAKPVAGAKPADTAKGEKK